MGRPCGCCCPGQTLWRLDSSGNIVWVANYFADYGTHPTFSGLFADQDADGNAYQGGIGSVPTISDPATTQPTIDHLRKYNSSGAKQWGWSAYPTGYEYDGTRYKTSLGPIATTANGTTAFTVASATTMQDLSLWKLNQRKIWAVNNTGALAWTNTTLDDVDASSHLITYDVMSAGTNYLVVRGTENHDSPIGPITNSFQGYILNQSDGSIVTKVFPKDLGLSTMEISTSLTMVLDRSDNLFISWSNEAVEQYDGAAVIAKVDIAATAAGGSDVYAWGTVCMYIRQPLRIETDGTYVVVTGGRDGGGAYPPNLSYDDYVWLSEIYDASTGALIQIQLIQDSPKDVFWHSLTAGKIGNGWQTFPDQIWKTDIGNSPNIHQLKQWSTFDGISGSPRVTCARIAADGTSTWTGNVCQASIFNESYYPPSCPGSVTYQNVAYDDGGSRGPYTELCYWSPVGGAGYNEPPTGCERPCYVWGCRRNGRTFGAEEPTQERRQLRSTAMVR